MDRMGDEKSVFEAVNKALTPEKGVNICQQAVGKAWESSCRAILGRSVGAMDRYAEYLERFVEPFRLEKSAVSGKTVAVTGNYEKNAKFISGDEIGQYAEKISKKKLNINEIKDIDSIIDALSGQIYYSGNDVLGNSSNAYLSNRVVDSSFVYKAHDVFFSKYVAYTYLSKYSEYAFGSESVGFGTHFAIKCFETYEDSRLFECVRTYLSSDCIYTANLENCQNCLFSFNLRSKRRCIGNLELNEAEFSKIKAKLQEDICQNLESKRKAISIIEIIGGN